MKTLGKLILGIATIALTACGGGDQKSNKSELSGVIKIDGSSTVYPITEAVAEEFRVVEPAVNVTVGVSGTGGGFKKFMREILISMMPLVLLRVKKLQRVTILVLDTKS